MQDLFRKQGVNNAIKSHLDMSINLRKKNRAALESDTNQLYNIRQKDVEDHINYQNYKLIEMSKKE